MAIYPIETLSGSATGQSVSSNESIDKNDFLILLVTQLQNQDPLNPMEPAEFTSQMAQFSSVEQLMNINESLGNLQKYQSALFDENAVSFIGKTIRVSDNTIEITENETEELHFELGKDASAVYVYIYDSDGSLVKEIAQTDSFCAGDQSLIWDGTDDNGNRVSEGNYYFEVQAVDNLGATFTGKPFYVGTVTSVNFWDGTAYLTIGSHDINIGNVVMVSSSSDG